MSLKFRVLSRLIAAAAVGAAVVCSGVVCGQSSPHKPASPVTYLTPTWGGIIGGSDTEVAAEVAKLRQRIGEGGGLKLGFAGYVFVNMGDWNVDLSSPTAIHAALVGFESQLDAGIRNARANNIAFAINMLTASRGNVDPAQRTSCDEDRRVMQWLGDNQAMDAWWTFSRYSRRQYRVRQAYMKEVAKIFASRIAQYPDTLVAISGDGEIELDSEQLPRVADYSPFTIAEFRDWLRAGGLYAKGAPFDGEAWAGAARYSGDASPDVDTNGDGHTLNKDFGTSFKSWNLRYFDWSLSDPDEPDPKAIPRNVYSDSAFNAMPDAGAQYFDAPRTIDNSDPWWVIWNQFRQTMVWRYNRDIARWMTTTPDDQGHLIPTDRWFSYQIPADYLFGGTPANPNERLVASGSPWWTANIMPYGGLGFTSFGVRFGTNTYLRTLPGFAGAIKTCAGGSAPPTCLDVPGGLAGASWGIFEWNPVVPLSSADAAARGTSQDELRREQLRRDQLRREQLRRWHAPSAGDSAVAAATTGSVGSQSSPGSGSSGTGPLPADTAIYRNEIELLRRYRPRVLAPFIWGSDQYRILDSGFEEALRQFSAYLRDGWTPSLRLDRALVPFSVKRERGTIAHYTSAQSVRISQPTGGTVDWSVKADSRWIVVSPESGHGDGSFSISLDPNRIERVPAGTYPAVITVSAPGSIEGSRTLQVPIVVTDELTPAPPFGSFDTPVDGSTGLQGSFALTGWALDDVEVDRVELWRDRVAGETTPVWHSPIGPDAADPRDGKIFIANPFFVTGSRTDVEASFPDFSFANRAGWGYLLLSWGLWNQGNDTYTLYAYAIDKEDHLALIGAKTVTVDNAHATKPFGALDTPGYGATVSGGFWNYGWALTPSATPACAVTNGNVSVSIDSGPLVPVAYGDSRSDIAAGFPGFSNGTNSGGAYYIDTSTLSNGTHQIGWMVTDSCGRQDGIGSRFFTVLNDAATPGSDGASPGLPALSAVEGKTRPTPIPEATRVDVGRDFSPVLRQRSGRPEPLSRGGTQARASAFHSIEEQSPPLSVRHNGAEWTSVAANDDGTRVVEVDQGDRFELQLPALRQGLYAGSLLVNGTRRALPLGSSLDAEAGIFYWQPSPGFLGAFDLTFDPATGSAGSVRVRAVVGPPMRLVIDTPASSSIVESRFTVSGWAVDLASRSGSGVDSVHVWAYPSGGGPPLWLGVAAIGSPRPEVGTLYGSTFADASFSLVVDGLPAGTYDIVAYAHRTATATFAVAHSVRVTVRQ